jgi:ribonuclease HI
MGKYTHLVVHTDGAARGNPGPAAIGVHIADSAALLTVGAFGSKLGDATNNEAEYRALLQAVKWLFERKALLANDVQIRFYLDAELIVKQLLGLNRINHPKLQELAEEVKSYLSQLPGTYTLVHIAREENTQADRLANDALDM